MDHILALKSEIIKAIGQTCTMVSISVAAAVMIGMPIGILLFLTAPGHLRSNRPVYRVASYAVNLVRSFPFLILLVALIPFSRMIVGTAIGPLAASVSLSVAAIPFYARLVEQSLREVPKGVIEAAVASGASMKHIVWGVLLSEARPGLVSGLTVTVISFISYSAAAGTVGGGGIGDLAIRYGYQRFDTEVMVACIVILVVIVQLVQWVGSFTASRLDKRK
ncbi:metal ABC transporter permease [Paenibacillus glycanilyticus]|uniref:Metal ABC transporter permease n=2 Tax=Paenibacillus glycanilyticus TaxID=126569 RepID=A0ABQ6GMA1_9BACL|nr:metal ABC transporter permease [Paenibacillus glycanilyticus]